MMQLFNKRTKKIMNKYQLAIPFVDMIELQLPVELKIIILNFSGHIRFGTRSISVCVYW